MQIDLTQVLIAIITMIFGQIARYVIPAIKEKATANQMELLRIAVKTAVYAAEQLDTSAEGTAKKAYVIELLAKEGYILDIDHVSATIDALIEAMVKELHIEQAKVSE